MLSQAIAVFERYLLTMLCLKLTGFDNTYAAVSIFKILSQQITKYTVSKKLSHFVIVHIFVKY